MGLRPGGMGARFGLPAILVPAIWHASSRRPRNGPAGPVETQLRAEERNNSALCGTDIMHDRLPSPLASRNDRNPGW